MTHGAPTGQYKVVKEPTHRLTDRPTQTQRMTRRIMSRNQSRKRQNEIERRKKSKQTYRHVQVNFMSHAFKSSSCKMRKIQQSCLLVSLTTSSKTMKDNKLSVSQRTSQKIKRLKLKELTATGRDLRAVTCKIQRKKS